ncbi:cation:proton antiporter [Anianabacter salinae]|uniref:cation:proton antiporter n=1 Tax=Anianabacter salinae TaxID=2851023 RepID=UPI00225E1875|nr:sodium:proton antiporter [Anianabacter salinae]MBV0911893.1 cation:proton antiporter [Anianabacter salinae]
MAIETAAGALSPVTAIALVGALGVGSQWLAWRLRLPAIVLMLVAGVIVGPVLGLFDPQRDIGPLTQPLIALAVAVILFEGGLTLEFHGLKDRARGVRRLVFVGAPLGWLLSALALHFGAGLSWESSAVFGGILIVTGPTVIAPLLRQARLSRRPAALLQWEAIVNDPIGALAAVLAFEVVQVLYTATTAGAAVTEFVLGIGIATALGFAGGFGVAQSFRRAKVPEYMKVPVIFAALLAVFAASDAFLHESGLLAVTVMGIVIANSDLPSFTEVRRFKEHATILLVSGVFILLAASLDFAALGALDWRAGLFVALVVLVARPVTVLAALMFTDVPVKERVLVATTGPRGVVLVAVAGLFGERLAALGVADGALVGPLAFVLVAVSVVLHGFTLGPIARALGLTGGDKPGVLLVGGNSFTVALGEALQKAEVPVLMADPNPTHLRAAWKSGLKTFYGDVLSDAAEDRIEMVAYTTVVAATDNDAYNTLVATDLAPEVGRANVYQVAREKSDSARYSLPASLGGRAFGQKQTFAAFRSLIWRDWTVRVTKLSEEFTLDDWRATNPEGIVIATIAKSNEIRFVVDDETLEPPKGGRIVALYPPEPQSAAAAAR